MKGQARLKSKVLSLSLLSSSMMNNFSDLVNKQICISEYGSQKGGFMGPIEFIEKNIRAALLKDGYSLAIVQAGIHEAIKHYKRTSGASKKGAMFDDCLYRARVHCEKYGMDSDKPVKKTGRKNKAPTAPTVQSLF